MNFFKPQPLVPLVRHLCFIWTQTPICKQTDSGRAEDAPGWPVPFSTPVLTLHAQKSSGVENGPSSFLEPTIFWPAAGSTIKKNRWGSGDENENGPVQVKF